MTTERTRIVLIEEGPELRDIPVREPAPVLALAPPAFAGTGPARGDYEGERAAVEYLPPTQRAA